MKSEAFLTYKDAFAEYIRRFILGLQKSSYNIESLLKQISAADMEAAAAKIAEYQLSIPRLEEAVERPIPVVGNHGHNDDHNSHHHTVRMYMPLKQQPVQIILRLV